MRESLHQKLPWTPEISEQPRKVVLEQATMISVAKYRCFVDTPPNMCDTYHSASQEALDEQSRRIKSSSPVKNERTSPQDELARCAQDASGQQQQQQQFKANLPTQYHFHANEPQHSSLPVYALYLPVTTEHGSNFGHLFGMSSQGTLLDRSTQAWTSAGMSTPHQNGTCLVMSRAFRFN